LTGLWQTRSKKNSLAKSIENQKIPTKKLAKINSLLTPFGYELIAKKHLFPRIDRPEPKEAQPPQGE
jgi:hypothetical protein